MLVKGRVFFFLKRRGWSSIQLRYRRGVRYVGEIAVIFLTQIEVTEKWVIGRSRVLIANIIDLVSSILGTMDS